MPYSKFALSHQIQYTLISLLSYYNVDSAQGHICLVPSAALVFGMDFVIYCSLGFLDLCLQLFAFPVSCLCLLNRCAYKTDVLHCSCPYRTIPNIQPNPILFIAPLTFSMSRFRLLGEIGKWAEDEKGRDIFCNTHLMAYPCPFAIHQIYFSVFWIFQEQGPLQKDVLGRHELSSSFQQ